VICRSSNRIGAKSPIRKKERPSDEQNLDLNILYFNGDFFITRIPPSVARSRGAGHSKFKLTKKQNKNYQLELLVFMKIE